MGLFCGCDNYRNRDAIHGIYSDELFWTMLDKARYFSSQIPMNCNLYHLPVGQDAGRDKGRWPLNKMP
jgi:hypothetical protein